MGRKPNWPPRVFSRRGKDYVRLVLGPNVYREYTLGASGSPEANARYVKLLAECQANGGRPAQEADATVLEVVAAFCKMAEARHDPKQYQRIRAALEPVAAAHRDEPAADFTPGKLERVREGYVEGGYCRGMVNSLTGIVRQAWRWAVVKGMVSYAAADALRMLPGLRRGESAAPERPKVVEAPLADVLATLGHLPPAVADMVRAQLYSGMRPAEVCGLTPGEVNRAWREVGGVRLWLYSPKRHKTERHGHERHVVLGPKAQAALSPYLDREPDAHCFSPHEVRVEWLSSRGQRVYFGKSRRPGRRYSSSAYAKCVRMACKRAGVPPWSPNRLRHTAATLIQTGFDRESARCVLGHSSSATTAVYAETLERAARVIAEVG